LVCLPPALLYLLAASKKCRKIGPDDLRHHLVFFSTIEELKLPISGSTESDAVTKLFEASPTPCLYVAPAVNMVGRIPLIPLFLAGNSKPTIPHKYSKHKNSGFPMGSCDTAAQDGRRGSNMYDVNTWLWQFGRGKPRLGGLSVDQTGGRNSLIFLCARACSGVFAFLCTRACG
jgi:hypothetical protein